VEDCPDAAATLALLLRLWGYDAEVAGDGRTALDAAAAFGPDVVLLDADLPDGDGHQFARRLRGEAQLRHAVLVSFSADAEDSQRHRCRQAGCDAHLVKPVEPRLLKVLLTLWTTQDRLRSPLDVRVAAIG
jgi:two-component system CheB/CheR fusion protein